MPKPHWNTTHGETHDRKISAEYRSWAKMLSRCYNPNSTRYERWGGRGIGVCAQWRHSVAQFIEDMGRKPSAKHSLERRDNNANYSPENCYWATAKEQARNTKRTINLTFNGKTQCLLDWAREYKIDQRLLKYRIFTAKWPLERALTERPAAQHDVSRLRRIS